jgi:hypothetical protein
MGQILGKMDGTKNMYFGNKKMHHMKPFIMRFIVCFFQFFIIAFFMTRLGVDTLYETMIVAIMMCLLIHFSTFARSMYEHQNSKILWIALLDDCIRIILGSILMVWMM